MLNVINVKKAYGDHTVLKNISFEVRPGEIVGIVGNNGTGKTTLMKLITGVYSLDDGNIIIDGKKVTQMRHGAKSVYYIQDSILVSATMTIRERFNEESTYYPFSDDTIYQKWMALLSIDENTALSRLSKGQQKAVHLGIALAMKPKYLLLDEFIDGIDQEMLDLLVDELKKSVKLGLSVIISSHALNELAILCTKLIVIEEGVSRVKTSIDTDKDKHFVQFITRDSFCNEIEGDFSIEKWFSIGNVYYAEVEGDLHSFQINITKKCNVETFSEVSFDDIKKFHYFFREVSRYDTKSTIN